MTDPIKVGAWRAPLLMLFRLLAITQVVLGVLFWTGRAYNLTNFHMGAGMVFVLAYLVLVATAKLGALRTTFAILLGLAIPAFGMLHVRLVVGPGHWTMQLLHLLLGIAAMAVVDQTAKALKAKQATTAA